MPASVWLILSKWEGLNDVKLWLPRSLWSTGTKMAEWKFKHCVICPPAQSGGPLQLYRCLSLFYWWTVTRPVPPPVWLEGPGANTAPGARNWSEDPAVFPGPKRKTKDQLAGWSALQTWRLLSGSKQEGAERAKSLTEVTVLLVLSLVVPKSCASPAQLSLCSLPSPGFHLELPTLDNGLPLREI